MLSLGVLEDEVETSEDIEGDRLPCMMQSIHSTCGVKEGEKMRSMPSNEPGKRAHGCSVMKCLEDLLDNFTGKDIKALADKASKLQSDDAIRKGFDDDTYFVKSTSASQPHVVKRVTWSPDGAGYSCDKECLGFVSRKICAHSVAVAHYSNNLKQFVSCLKNTRCSPDNLMALTTVSVNWAAGKKNPNHQTRQRKKSPDVRKSMAPCKNTLGDALANTVTAQEYSVVATSDLRLTTRKNRPPKPSVSPTTSTPFQLIEIKGKVCKCAGCGGDLKDCPDPYTKGDLDELICIRHKEHDYVWIEGHKLYKKTFENKHFHVFHNCLIGRSPGFDFTHVQMCIPYTLTASQLSFLKDRLNGLSCCYFKAWTSMGWQEPLSTVSFIVKTFHLIEQVNLV